MKYKCHKTACGTHTALISDTWNPLSKLTWGKIGESLVNVALLFNPQCKSAAAQAPDVLHFIWIELRLEKTQKLIEMMNKHRKIVNSAVTSFCKAFGQPTSTITQINQFSSN